ncbi:MAG: hypothetical protein JNJ88_00630 [Planctomycetes bacterium]|nr:hypothetical protein [Planctomycetota bacterium]
MRRRMKAPATGSGRHTNRHRAGHAPRRPAGAPADPTYVMEIYVIEGARADATSAMQGARAGPTAQSEFNVLAPLLAVDLLQVRCADRPHGSMAPRNSEWGEDLFLRVRRESR